MFNWVCKVDYGFYFYVVEKSVVFEYVWMFLYVNYYVYWFGNVDLLNLYKFFVLCVYSYV